MQAIIITIGDELLIGQTIDTNSSEIALALASLQIEVINRWAIADKIEDIHFFLDLALGKADLVIFTGGLGPTADDLTKTALCSYFNGKLQRNHDVYKHLDGWFASKNLSLTPRNAAQADVPDVCEVLPNLMGTAPGMLFRTGKKIVASLPGVPFEMRHILQCALMPILGREVVSDKYMHHSYLAITGIGESNLADLILDIETAMPQNVHLAYLPTHRLIKLRLSVQAESAGTAQTQSEFWLNQLEQRIQKYLVAREDISWAEIVQNLFVNKGLALSTAESCTGGYFGHLITNLPGSSAYYKGGMITYANELKINFLEVSEKVLEDHGAVSEETVLAMAKGAVEKFGSDYAISFSGILGPGGGNEKKPVGLIWMAVANGQSAIAERLNLRYDRISNKEAAAAAGFALLYRFVNQHLPS